ncbi:hypothetical protein BCV70DRAFT_76335 [Testicularia cyperi]|uniref:Uncharacterized protein n=1 Tax=Testicularia cyperi TaxID=1882483 RepID=A0A317XTF4_9BASI|nr:hypothetical protein BCV70DRAFT_76335 [Testicularia cyperi]
MSTLEGAVPPLGITRLRLWDELHNVHRLAYLEQHQSEVNCLTTSCATPQTTYREWTTPFAHPYLPHEYLPPVSAEACLSSQPPTTTITTTTTNTNTNTNTNTGDAFRSATHPSADAQGWPVGIVSYIPPTFVAPTSQRTLPWPRHPQENKIAPLGTYTNPFGPGSWDTPYPEKPGSSAAKPGHTRRRPPPLASRIKAKARRANRKKSKALRRRDLFRLQLSDRTLHPVTERQSYGERPESSKTAGGTTGGLGFGFDPVFRISELTRGEVASIEAVAFDTDAQSSEYTDPEDISDVELSRSTLFEISERLGSDGSRDLVPKGVFRWMVAKDFAERWPEKVGHVRKNPWRGMEEMWGERSGVDGRAMRWQSGRRSSLVRPRSRADGAGRKDKVSQAGLRRTLLRPEEPGGRTWDTEQDPSIQAMPTSSIGPDHSLARALVGSSTRESQHQTQVASQTQTQAPSDTHPSHPAYPADLSTSCSLSLQSTYPSIPTSCLDTTLLSTAVPIHL